MESPQPACYGVQVLITSDRRGLWAALPQVLLGACQGLFMVAALVSGRIAAVVAVATAVAWVTVTTTDTIAAAVTVVTVQEPVPQDLSQYTRPFSFYYYYSFSYRVMSSCGACHQQWACEKQ